jgi:hypothetical protein
MCTLYIGETTQKEKKKEGRKKKDTLIEIVDRPALQDFISLSLAGLGGPLNMPYIQTQYVFHFPSGSLSLCVCMRIV